MKTVTWIAPEREIPTVGVAKTGEPIEMPDELADRFIAQGEAKPLSSSRVTVKKAEKGGAE